MSIALSKYRILTVIVCIRLLWLAQYLLSLIVPFNCFVQLTKVPYHGDFQLAFSFASVSDKLAIESNVKCFYNRITTWWSSPIIIRRRLQHQHAANRKWFALQEKRISRHFGKCYGNIGMTCVSRKAGHEKLEVKRKF